MMTSDSLAIIQGQLIQTAALVLRMDLYALLAHTQDPDVRDLTQTLIVFQMRTQQIISADPTTDLAKALSQ